jgi:TnpA family transposase
VRSRYIHKEQLRNAIAHVANAIFEARRAEIWGEGTTACASDSKKFGAWNQNLLTEWHIRYRGAWNHDILACPKKVYLHLFSTQKLFFLRSCGHD